MRSVELNVASGDDLDVRSFNLVEAMSASFRLDVIARAREDALDLYGVVGKHASLHLRDEVGARTWTGVCAHIAQTGVESRGLSTYSLRIVPSLWLLTHRRGHRLFQHLSVPAIVEKLLHEWGLRPKIELTHHYPKLALRTQYGESDYDFVRRLLAEAGISFYFRDEGKESRLVLSDAPASAAPRHAPIPFQASHPPSISHVNIASHVVPGKVTLVDHDFRRPRYALAGSHGAHAMLERYHYVPGLSLSEAHTTTAEPVADHHGVYRYNDHLVQESAHRRAEGHRSNQTQIGFQTSCIDLEPGTVFSIEGHPHPEVAQGKKLLVTSAWLQGDVGAAGWHAGGTAVPADLAFRPAVDHRSEPSTSPDPFEPIVHTGKPRIFGVETATVTGPAGEEIHTDEHGRVTVHFPWDRESAHDEKSSPWVRVSQAWAGPGHSVHTLPRVGTEVLVAFHDGDPDQPVIVGRVHDATAPVPYTLPEHKARTSIRSTSEAGANEITFDDTPGKELFYMQATRDLHKLVKHDELEHTQGSRHIHVDGDLILSSGGKLSLLAGKDLVVKGGPKVLLNPSESPKPAKKPAPLKAKKKTSTGGVSAEPAHPKHHPKPHHDKGGISENGRKEMAALMRVAQAYAGGKRPEGWCLKKVEDYLQEVSYGKIGHGNIPRFPYAHDFADYLNQGHRYDSLGLQKLPITNPYDAPEGSIIVVRAGTPGTHNPVAGDIVVKGPGDHFYNDGEMGYGGPGNFPKGNNYVLGIYAPK